jgi:hypothetical protein
MQCGISQSRRITAAAYVQIWQTFCQQHELDAHLSEVEDPVFWLQIFAARVRDGRLSASGKCVRSSTVADALTFVAQTFTFLGAPDPRFQSGRNILHPRLARQLKGYSKFDDDPSRVKPIPVPILHEATRLALADGSDLALAASDMMWLAFFFLLRPGEYTKPASDSHPFRVCDVKLWANHDPIDISQATNDALLASTFVSLTFSTQKNGTRGEIIGHGRSNNPNACPVLSVARRLLYLRSLHAPPTAYLCAVGPTLRPLTSAPITKFLRKACTTVLNTAGILPTDITARSLRASGAMALLHEGVDSQTIQLVGRWKSDAMLRYLHIQAHDLMKDFSSIMLHGGNYSLIPLHPTAPLPTFH